MIHVETPGPRGPAYEAWRRRAEKSLSQVLAAWKQGHQIVHKELWKELKPIFLSDVFKDKCAYCEGRHRDGFPLHVEHYRPKLAVTEQRVEINHPGYFWLAYEWWNLVTSCASCNSAHTERDGTKHPGKANEFRITRVRVSAPSENITSWQLEVDAEEPLLLNPYADHPEEHIDFDSIGFPFPKNGSVKGGETIEVCHLDRPSLIDARQEQLNSILVAAFRRLSGLDAQQEFSAAAAFSLWRKRKLSYMLVELQELAKVEHSQPL